MRISITTTTRGSVTTGYWRFATTNQDPTSATSTAASESSQPVHLWTWTHLTVTYDASNGRMTLYVDGVPSAGATNTTTWSSGCNTFALDRWNNAGSLAGGFNGKIADVQAWNGIYLTPTQAATLSGTPGYVLFPSDSHQYGSAPSSTTYQWVTAHAKMQFYQGVLMITETGTGTATKTYGAAGYAGAVLTLQTDGNLVIYQTAGDATAANTGAIWSSGTWGHNGDVMFFQPDGNLVIYTPDGQALWSSGTWN
jgi:Concanavalin A-like lectin/glucanases superfamily